MTLTHLDNARFLLEMAERFEHAADGPGPDLVTVTLSEADVARMLALCGAAEYPEAHAVLLALQAQCATENN